MESNRRPDCFTASRSCNKDRPLKLGLSKYGFSKSQSQINALFQTTLLMSQDTVSEAKTICEILRAGVPNKWDGRKCILELREANYQWRQMEWIGWYFEYKAISLLRSFFGSHPGPEFGSTRFDFKLNYVWDF